VIRRGGGTFRERGREPPTKEASASFGRLYERSCEGREDRLANFRRAACDVAREKGKNGGEERGKKGKGTEKREDREGVDEEDKRRIESFPRN